MLTDAVSAKATTNNYAPVQTLSISYIKQNAGTELNWRPSRTWNLGVAYGFEHYNWLRADTNATNENSTKVYADWKPTGWITARVSALEARRRYEAYNYLAFFGYWQWPTPATPPALTTSTQYSPAYRQFMFDDRDRRIAQGSLAIDLFRGVTVTPTFSAKDDDYRLDPTKEVGLRYYKSVSAGVELAWLITPGTRFLVSYTKDRRNQLITSAGGNVAPFPATAYYNAEVADLVHTYIAGVTWEAIPSALDVAVTYSYVSTSNTQPLIFMNGTVPSLATGGQYPERPQRLPTTGSHGEIHV